MVFSPAWCVPRSWRISGRLGHVRGSLMVFQETSWKKDVGKAEPSVKSYTALDFSYLLNPEINLTVEIKNVSEKAL